MGAQKSGGAGNRTRVLAEPALSLYMFSTLFSLTDITPMHRIDARQSISFAALP